MSMDATFDSEKTVTRSVKIIVPFYISPSLNIQITRAYKISFKTKFRATFNQV